MILLIHRVVTLPIIERRRYNMKEVKTVLTTSKLWGGAIL